jgi:hypothetical protein
MRAVCFSSLSLVLLFEPTLAMGDLSTRATPPDGLSKEASFEGEPGWLVIGEVTRSPREAARLTEQRVLAQVNVTPISTDYFQNLRKGYIALVYGAFKEKRLAETRTDELRKKGIKVDMKHSGPLIQRHRDVPVRLVRFWGRLSETIRFPTRVEIDDNQRTMDVFTDTHGNYQAWLLIDQNVGGELSISADLEMATKVDGCMGWMDKTATVSYSATARDVHVDWSPSPDCCDR